MQRFYISIFLAGTVMSMLADTSPLWLRSAAISPDGKTIAFTFRGDIYTVSSEGGKAFQLTSGDDFEKAPVWSPDGSKIAFSSNKAGTHDVYIIPSEGGNARRLTSHSGTEIPLFFMDDENVIFTASMMPDADDVSGFISEQIYTVPVSGGRARQYASLPVLSVSVDKNGRMLYQDKKGVEDPFRKHERSSGTSDIWIIENGQHRKLTDFNGHDMNPVWAGEDSFFYISEEDGTLNVWKSDMQGNRVQLTHFTQHPVRSLSASTAGVLAFSRDGEIYTVKEGENPRKVNIEINSYGPPEEPLITRKILKNGGVTSFCPSPDGDEIAFVKDGDVYVTSVKYATTKRVTSTPEQERTVQFSPDGKSLIYDSERNGLWQLYKTEISDPEEKSFTYSSELKESRILNTDKTSFQPLVSPDGKKIAYLENRCGINVLDVATGKIVNVLPEERNYSYTDGDVYFCWSPDSEWLATSYMGPDGWNNMDMALVKADGSEVINMTESGYTDSGMRFVMDGKGVAWMSDKAGMRSHGSWGTQSDVYVMFLDPAAYNKFRLTEEELSEAEKKEKDDSADKTDSRNSGKGKKKESKAAPVRFDFENRKDRMVRITPSSTAIEDFYLDEDGANLYYLASYEDGMDFWKVDLKEGNISRVSKDVQAADIIPGKDGKKLFLGGSGGMMVYDVEKNNLEEVSFEATGDYDPYSRREYIFDHIRSLVADKFYDEKIHGVDWEGYTEHYKKFLPYINNDYDFAELLSELLGELNASHTGARYRPGVPAQEDTGYLGAFFNDNSDEDGLLIREIVAGGPLAETGLRQGDMILAIDGKPIKADEDYYAQLGGKVNKRVLLTVKTPEGERKFNVRPISASVNKDLLYHRWVKHNQKVVDSLSNGRVAYVHVRNMNSPSFRAVYDELLGKYRNREAVIVDTRHNGGGWLHNDLVVLLSGKEYVTFDPRGRRIGHEPFSRWTKPSVMLVNESNYSDAYGTPYSYKTLNIGKLVGAPVPGTMTAVWWEYQINPSIVFGVPQVTNTDLEGRPLENQQLNPDVLIYNNPGDMLRGIDRQLEGAVRELLK